jgi:hypothetical protein
MLWRYHWISFSLALNTYVLVETAAPAWQYIAIPGCVIFAAWIGIRAAECWKAGQWGAATGASLMFIMTVLANIYVAITAAALTHDAAIGSRSAKIQRTDSITAEIKDTREELRRQRSATAGATEGQIQAVLDRLEANPIFREEKRSNRCANDTAAESRTLCDQWRDEKGRLAAAQRITVLEERLGKLQQLSWNGTAATEQMIDADPGAKAMATITGLSEKLITAGFTGYLAVLLELIAAFAPAFCSPPPEPGEGSRNPVSKTKPNTVAAKVEAGLRKAHQGAKVAAKVREPSPEPVLTKPADPFSTWVAAKTFRVNDGSVNASALGESYDAWAAGSELPPITATMLGRKLRAMGIEKRKIGGRMAYTGIAIKSAPVLTVVGRTPENIARRAGTSTEI